MKQLQKEFIGRGEVRGFTFKQIERTEKAYLYEVTQPYADKPHYEVFRHKINKRFGVVSYPFSGEGFGRWAWTYKSLSEAREKLAEITWGKTCPNLPPVSRVLELEIQE